MPGYDYLFFGDTANMPYWEKTPEQIKNYTFQALQWLFEHDCALVIIACNTAAAYSIRPRQEQYPALKTLSVTISGIEALVAHPVRSTLFLSTKATEQSGILADLSYKYGFQWSLTIKACPGFADIIESDAKNPLSWEEKKRIITDFVGDASDYDSVFLACTHYGIWYKEFVELYPDHIIIDPSQECATKLKSYLVSHPEIASVLSRWASVEEYWT